MNIVPEVESQTLEHKKSLALRREALRALCGMLNADTASGTVVFGIAPDRQVVGVEPGDIDKAQRSLAQSIRETFDPPVQCTIRSEQYGDKTLLVLSAGRSPEVPYHEFEGCAYLREGTSTRRVTLEEKQSIQRRRNRAVHPGPCRCDRCGSWVGLLAAIVVTDDGPRRSFKCPCGGEFWPFR